MGGIASRRGRMAKLMAEIAAASHEYIAVNKNAGTDHDRMDQIRAASQRLVQAYLAVIRLAR